MALNETKINTCTCACMHTHTQHLFVGPFYQTRRTQAGKRLLPSGKGTQRHGGVCFSTVLALSILINSLLWLQLNTSAKKYGKNVTFCSITSQLHIHKHSFLNLCNWVRKRSIYSSLIACGVGHLNLHTWIYMKNCIYPNFPNLKYFTLTILKHTRKEGKPCCITKISSLNVRPKKQKPVRNTGNRNSETTLFSERKVQFHFFYYRLEQFCHNGVYLYDLLQLSQPEVLLNDCKMHGACMSLHSCVSC